ncbi:MULTISPECIES: protein-disulfide reductase DsbD [Acinetobacter]|uniref:Protein-disulfide reductase DsbD n=1 Tax=Acinetobacter piscicola TaxID=2006115 RepID=A0A7S6VWM2_9GAMM|nr:MULTISPECIES: protein-disulfide reductase DsbD [Acinetobacter]QOW46198.1 protein-disulfide reductase DsbD [Acinetobacter piscicola]
MFIKTLTGVVLSLASTAIFANEDFLPPDQAFKFQAHSISQQQAELNWQVAPHYYLYHDQFKVSVAQKELALKLPQGKEKDDPTFGKTNVHYHQVTTTLNVKPNQEYRVQWQGCSEDGLCYPLQHTTIQTDASGLLPQQKLAKVGINPSAPLLENNTSENNRLLKNTVADDAVPIKEQTAELDKTKNIPPETTLVQEDDSSASQVQTIQATSSNAATPIPEQQNESLQNELNNDQFFLKLLNQQNIFLNILLFLALGILLAFLPCSLPLIPILSGILVQRSKGYKAAAIASTFVICMALVYGLMGVVVSQLGFGIQRWFQNPIFISVFAILFVVFALNLFGLYQISLPRGLLQRLDQLQQRQKGGTLVGAGMMGAISALIVGPCMSAPLAGALLYVSHLEQPVWGGFYLFLLGLGIGIPLFVASVFGSKYLPKPGLWMDRLKFSFGFVMLLMAVYFARPLLPSMIYFVLLAILLFAMTIYLFAIIRHVVQLPYKILVLVIALATASAGIWQTRQALQQMNAAEKLAQLHPWIKVSNAQQLEQVLAQNTQKSIIIDVYADWCVACQPIEKEVFPRADVQAAVQDVVRIKLDLTHPEASQDALLKKWQILGPPTMIFLNAQQQEMRDLRLTGTFTAPQFLQKLVQLKQENTQ